ncbi:MAG: WD40 repeat domain-containing protein [Candidatus Hodarchaeota archaeon]
MEEELIPETAFEGHEFTVWSLAFSPDGRFLLSGGQDASVRVWDLEARREMHVLPGHRGAVYGIAVMADGSRAVSIADMDLAVRIWDFERGNLVTALAPNSAHINAVAVTPDNRYVLTGGDDGKVRIWDIDSGVLLRVLDHSESIYSIKVSPNGQYLIVGAKAQPGTDERGLIWIWEFDLGVLLHTLDGHDGHVTRLTMTADSRYILSGSQDGSVKLWDLETGTLLNDMRGHDAAILAIKLTPDGRHIVTGSADGTLRLWQLHGGVLIHSIPHTENIHSIVVSDDARRIATGDVDGTVQLWDFRVGTSWIDTSVEREEDRRAELEAFRLVQLRKVINRYETLPLERLQTLLRFDSLEALEDWLLELPEETPVKVDGDLLIIKK